jgi:hypothetical protein
MRAGVQRAGDGLQASQNEGQPRSAAVFGRGAGVGGSRIESALKSKRENKQHGANSSHC